MRLAVIAGARATLRPLRFCSRRPIMLPELHVLPINEHKHEWAYANGLHLYGFFLSFFLSLIESIVFTLSQPPALTFVILLFFIHILLVHQTLTNTIDIWSFRPIDHGGARLSALHGQSHTPQHLPAVNSHQQEGHLEAFGPRVCGKVSRQRPTGT